MKKIFTVAPFVAALFLLSCGAKNMNEERIQASPNFKNGKATNQVETPMMSGDFSTIGVMWELFVKAPRPEKPIPSTKDGLEFADSSEESMIWLGHSSMLLQTGGKRILIDPVLSEAASPVPFANKPFEGTALYTADDVPQIDYLIITHDHYDHLSKTSVKSLRDKVGLVICPLGVGKYFKEWGYPEDNIIELDWNESYTTNDGFNIYCLTARHFSGRSLTNRNGTLWASFLVETPERKIYFSGDSGYGEHFKAIGERFGGVDLAFMENGQYDPRWKYIHMFPDETLAAGKDVGTKFLMPIHNSKYKLSAHAWNAPLDNISELHSDDTEMILMTPKIGEKVPLWDEAYTYQKWWNEPENQ